MTTSTSWKLRALLKKNLLILKRNIFSTSFEIFFPIILITLCLVLKQAFEVKTYLYTDQETNDTEYIKDKSSFYFNYSSLSDLYSSSEDTSLGLSILPILKICSAQNSQRKKRPVIASIGNPGLGQSLKNKIKNESNIENDLELDYMDFASINDLNKYIKDKAYGNDNAHPEICFGVRIDRNENEHNWDYSLHYFDSGSTDIPNLGGGLLNRFQTGPDLESYKKYQENGFLYMMKIINEYILGQEGYSDFNIG